ncbi:MAG: hypothetical protein QOF76_1622 [Solirubrobacteraceae bacterium]|jgi:hypothetical protein|nr:hypothetical protein [Solirubrobacteraceae bacterium]
MRAPLLLVAPVLAAFAFSGCATTIDDKKGEEALQKSQEQLGIKVKSVDCPSGKTAKKGDVFTCTVTAQDGSSGDITVTETDAKGNVTYNQPFIKPKTLADAVAAKFSQESGVDGITADCPDIVELKQGAQTECEASKNRDKVTLVVKFSANGIASVRPKGQ